MWKIDPSLPQTTYPIITKLFTFDDVGGIYHPAKFIHIGRGVSFLRMRDFDIKKVITCLGYMSFCY